VPLAIAAASAVTLGIVGSGLHGWKVLLSIGVLTADLLSVALTFNPTTSPDVFDREPASVAFLRRDPSLYRTASFIADDRLPPQVAQSQLAISWAIAYGIEDINGFNSLQPRRYTDVLFGPEVGDVSYGFLRDERLLEPTHQLLSMLNVKYALVQPQSVQWNPLMQQALSSDQDVEPDEAQRWRRVYQDNDVTIYRNPTPYPRAYFVFNVSVVNEPQTVLSIIKQPGFVPLEQAVVEGGLSDRQVVNLSRQGRAVVEVERVSPNELRLHVESDAERFLVLSEMWFPGWTADIDGRDLPIHRTNYLLRGMVVPTGTYTITMKYQPASAFVGLAITMTTIGSISIAFVVNSRKRAR
jgi:hypothetical protein